LSPRGRAERALEQLSSCGPDDEGPAVQLLVSLGTDGLDAVEATFPGLLWFHRTLAHSAVPRGRDCGPSCRVIDAFGDRAIPMLTRLLVGHADARYYAALLAIDRLKEANAHHSRVLVSALLQRVLDDDRGVATISLAALNDIRSSPVLIAEAGALCARASDATQLADKRAQALRVLAGLRWRALVPTSIELLEDADSTIRSFANGALRLMTTARPRSLAAWQRWWAKNSDVPRSEWLIEGLASRDGPLRSVAHNELKTMVGDAAHYDVSMGRLSRRRAQRAFRDAVAAHEKSPFDTGC